jgi:medium-chain acyl-[acyl-carrier-protein] hydrolase
MRSRRRGALSDDPETKDRREWYKSLQDRLLKERLDKEFDVMASMGTTDSSTVDATKEVNNKPVVKIKEFKSSAMDIANELEKNAASASTIKDKPDTVETYIKPVDFVPQKWIVQLYKSTSTEIGKRNVLILFPGIGSSPLGFTDWVKYFISDPIDIYSVCLPGRMNRVLEQMPKSTVPIIGSIMDALIDLGIIPSLPPESIDECDCRLLLFGHHFGALLAYELSRYLIIKGYEVVISHLFVSSLRSPSILSEYNSDKFGKKIYYGNTKTIIDAVIALDGIPPDFKEKREFIQLCVPLYRADFTILEKYVFKPYLNEHMPPLAMPVISIGTENDINCNVNDLAAWRKESSSKSFHFTFREGGHGYLKSPFYLEQIIEAIKCLLIDDNLDLKFEREPEQAVADYFDSIKIEEKVSKNKKK